MWVLTREENEYDQFVAAWLTKPTEQELKDVLDITYATEYVHHILQGGGRTEKMEDTWYNLFEYEDGTLY